MKSAFLDANVPFSAALPGSSLKAALEKSGLRLVSSGYCEDVFAAGEKIMQRRVHFEPGVPPSQNFHGQIRRATPGPAGREIQGDTSVFQYYPFQVISVDYIKSEARRNVFIEQCPELAEAEKRETASRGIFAQHAIKARETREIYPFPIWLVLFTLSTNEVDGCHSNVGTGSVPRTSSGFAGGEFPARWLFPWLSRGRRLIRNGWRNYTGRRGHSFH